MTDPSSPSSPELAARPRLWLVRHGETEWSRLGRHTSRTDVPLTARGRADAAGIAAMLSGHRFVAVLSSPMRRALETAALAGYGDRVAVTEDLGEWQYGDDEGRTTDEIRRDRPGWSIWQTGPRGGETIDEVAARADRLIAVARAGTGDVLCFGHAHCMRVVAARWLGLPGDGGRLFALAPATLSVLGWERDMPVLERWNQACGG